jgi:UDP-N-acetyl-D-glucosamine/UDP-N-acetyl-D-galactosamine dehydrogenase
VSHGRRIAVVGLGYVGLPAAVTFAKSGVPVIGFDRDVNRIRELLEGRDRTRQYQPSDLSFSDLTLTDRAQDLSAADFFLITVPGLIDGARSPDLLPILKASEDVGRALKPGDIVVYESTMHPGATEEHCIPVLQKTSGRVAGRDFGVGYSPERINPGDPNHGFASIKKVVAAQDAGTLDILADVYGSVVTAGICRAASIRVAETAKCFENVQRDVNIALVNELSAIAHALNIDTADVLATAASKWNFVPFTPGLVGGRCMTNDPYLLMHAAECAGAPTELISSARRVNDGVQDRIVRECGLMLHCLGSPPYRVVVLGLTFKENIPDIRNSGVVGIVRALQAFGAVVQVHDPLADAGDAQRIGIDLIALDQLPGADAVVLAVPHEAYLSQGWPLMVRLLRNGSGLVMDIRGRLDRCAIPPGVKLWRL